MIRIEKLWENFWITQSGFKKVESYNISYNHGTLSIDNPDKSRQAFVDTTLDERMHAVGNIRDLYLLSEEWAKDTALEIKNILTKNKDSTIGILLRNNYQVNSWAEFINNAGLKTITRNRI